MPLGKYYCDYCDKQFQDTPSARKRHLEGVQHQRARSLWYKSIEAGISPEDGARGICHHFVRTGSCQYGDGCKYFHPKQNLPNANQSLLGPRLTETIQSPVLVDNQLIGGSLTGDIVRDRTGISWGNLPPSLRPPPEGGYPSLPFVDWG